MLLGELIQRLNDYAKGENFEILRDFPCQTYFFLEEKPTVLMENHTKFQDVFKDVRDKKVDEETFRKAAYLLAFY